MTLAPDVFGTAWLARWGGVSPVSHDKNCACRRAVDQNLTRSTRTIAVSRRVANAEPWPGRRYNATRGNLLRVRFRYTWDVFEGQPSHNHQNF
jgi:hypothetical protein